MFSYQSPLRCGKDRANLKKEAIYFYPAREEAGKMKKSPFFRISVVI